MVSLVLILYNGIVSWHMISKTNESSAKNTSNDCPRSVDRLSLTIQVRNCFCVDLDEMKKDIEQQDKWEN